MGRVMRRMRRHAREEHGSTLPLILGYAVLALAVIFVCVNATDLHIAQKRLDALADAAALAGTEGFTVSVAGGVIRAELNDTAVHARSAAIVAAMGSGAVLVTAHTPDGVSVEATVASVWHPVLFSPFVPEGVPLRATARARTALRS